MADSKLRVNLIGDASSLNRSLQVASKRLETFGKRASQVGKDLSLRLTLPIGAAAAASIKMASDMEESTNKVRVAFGSSSKSVEAFAKTALRSFGIAESSALDMTALFGDMATGMGVSQSEAANLSTQLVGLAGDLASFKNINIEEVTTALSGVFTGETESLKRLGIVMTEVNLEQFRLNEGINKSVKEMTQQEKIMLRLRYIFSVTKNAQGDFARTSEGAANQMRIFQETLKEVAAELGKVMLPTFTEAITKVNNLLDEFRGLEDGTKRTVVQIGLLTAAVPPLIYILGQLAISFSALYTAISKVPPIVGAVTAAATAGAIAFDQLSKAIAPNLDFFERLGTALNYIATPNLIAPMLAQRDAIKQVTEAQKEANKTREKARQAFGAPVSIGTAGFGTGVQIVTPIGEEQALKNMDAAVRAAEKAGDAIDEMLATDPTLTYALATESAAVESFGNVIKQVAEDVRTPLDVINQGVQQMSELSKNLIMGIGQGLTSAFQQAMTSGENFVTSLGNMLKDLIKRLLAAAAAAAILSSIFPGLGTFSQLFGSFSGFGGAGVGGGAGFQFNPINPSLGTNIGLGNIAPRSNNIALSGQFRIDGQDLVVAVERANNQRSNFTG